MVNIESRAGCEELTKELRQDVTGFGGCQMRLGHGWCHANQRVPAYLVRHPTSRHTSNVVQ